MSNDPSDLVTPISEQSLHEYEHIHELDFFHRNFRHMGEGSLRLSTINLMLCGIGGFYWYPMVFRTYGIAPALALIGLFVGQNYLICSYICKVSEQGKCNNYLGLISRVLGAGWKRVARVTYLVDYFNAYMGSFLLSWNIFAYLFYYWGLIDDDKLEDKERLIFKAYDPQIVLLRFLVIAVGVCVSVPLFLKQKMDSFKFIIMGFIFLIFLTIAYLVVDLPEFKAHYTETGDWAVSWAKPPALDSFRFLFIFMCSYNIQSNLLTIKRNTFNPVERRMMKTIRITHVFFFLFAAGFGLYGYYCLGDKYTTDLFMLRKAFDGKQHEFLYRAILTCLATAYVLYMSFFILSFRSFIYSNFGSAPNFHAVSLSPLTVAAVLALAYPKIVNYFGYCSVTINLMDGFLFPIMMRRRLYLNEEGKTWRVWLMNLHICALCCLAATALTALIKNDLGF